jgi:hypothetical protein
MQGLVSAISGAIAWIIGFTHRRITTGACRENLTWVALHIRPNINSNVMAWIIGIAHRRITAGARIIERTCARAGMKQGRHAKHQCAETRSKD